MTAPRLAPLLALPALLLLLVAAQSAGPPFSPDPDLEPGTLVATINGAAYEAGIAVALRRCPIPSRCTITVRTEAEVAFGEDAPPTTGLRFTLVRAQDEPAAYDLTHLSRAHVSLPDDAGATTTYTVSADGGSGTVEVTALSEERFQGTFAFTAVADDGSTIVVTEGAFHLEFT